MANVCWLSLGNPAHKIRQVKFILVSALGYYFRTFVQQRGLVCGDNHKLLRQTEVTSLGQVRVRRGLSQYIPSHAEDFTFTFETPDILRQLRLVRILIMPKAHQVVRVALFKSCFRRTNVYFRSTGTVCFYSRLIHDLAGEAMPVQWTSFRFAAIAALRLVTVPLFYSTYTGIVLFDYTSHIGHTTVAHFDRVPIKPFP